MIFERFLNPKRISLPDIDIDFCERRRGEVIEYVTQKYGRENVAQIITFGTMKARAAVRDVGRSLDIPFADVDRVAKLIPATLDMTLDKALEEVPQLKQAAERDERVKELLSVARRLEGMTRHASVHAAGVVIAPKSIIEFAPLYKGKNDEITTQWAMKEIERIGLLKMDFLGLSTLTLLNDAVEQIRATTGDVLDLDTIPLDDAKTYQIFAEGATYGIFQFESSGMRDILRKAKPQRLDDLIALNALYRPGPLRSGMVDDFIARKHGKVKVTYEVKELEPILADTYGVIAYQEQVMRIASALAGFTLGEADLLRKAMGKKKADVMQAQRTKFVTGAVSRGINEKKATKIFDLMEHFAGYGFNKSHSTAYALLAYQTAYLKANYPWHFAAALLTIEAQNTDKLAMYLAECRERNIPVLPPDINQSQLAFTVTSGRRAIRPHGGQERRRRRNCLHPRRARRSGQRSRRCIHCAMSSICGSSTSACSRASSRRVPSIRSQPARKRRSANCGRGSWRQSIRHANTVRDASAIGSSVRLSCLAARPAIRAIRTRRGGLAGEFGAMDRSAATGLREGVARSVFQRPPHRSSRGGAQGVRREDDCRAQRRRRGASAGDRLGATGRWASSPECGPNLGRRSHGTRKGGGRSEASSRQSGR